jgi:hypothetical protein
MNFYSAKLFFIVLIDDGKPKGKRTFEESVVVFRAKDFDHAFERALEIGRKAETSYINGFGQNVRWAFVKILNLDFVGKRIDGTEVNSKRYFKIPKPEISFDEKFHPEKSEPEQTI